MEPKTSIQRVAVPQFVSGLRQLPASAFDVTGAVLEYSKANPVDPASLEPYLFWDRQHYTRNLIDKTDLYELIAICWEVGQVSSIHNHKGQNCWMQVPIGRLMVQNYRVLAEDVSQHTCKLEPADLVEMCPGKPLAVNPKQPVHSVFNPKEFAERAVSLHIYSRPFDSCMVYSAEQGTCGEIGLHYTSVNGIPVKR